MSDNWLRRNQFEVQKILRWEWTLPGVKASRIQQPKELEDGNIEYFTSEAFTGILAQMSMMLGNALAWVEVNKALQVVILQKCEGSLYQYSTSLTTMTCSERVFSIILL